MARRRGRPGRSRRTKVRSLGQLWSLGLRSSRRLLPRQRKRRSKKMRRSPNYWFQHDELTLSKILIRDVELLWLSLNAPDAKVTWEKVPGCENMPAYRSGKWNGYAHFVRFPPDQKDNALLFRIEWWSRKC